MSASVLQSKSQYKEARSILKERGLDCASSPFSRLMRKLHLQSGVSIGDKVKSWDVLKTVEFIEHAVPRDAAVLDIGAFGSEIPCILQKLSYTNLTGVDLNPKLTDMPHQDRIRYVLSDFMQMPFSDRSFDIVTAISVIEHGFNAKRLLSELSRIIKQNGYFIASIDYWPDKLDTSGTLVFGMDWIIFSKTELLSFFKEAEAYGFTPQGAVDLDASSPQIAWQGREYSFAWFVLKKTK